MFNNKRVLVTGGTGSFGKKFVDVVLKRYKPKRLIIFSRDELKQFEMQRTFNGAEYPCLRYFIGDVRDRERLSRAFSSADVVIHAAALKQVPACEYNPLEAIKTNIMGAANVIDVAIDQRVERVIALSTDKAANPVNLYGATKLCSDKLFIAGNSYSGHHSTRFSIVRYGNVMGSRGSVVPFFMEKRNEGVLPITDARMTRFWITLEQACDFVLDCVHKMAGGEIFVPRIPSVRIIDLIKAIAPQCKIKVVGIRPGEKLHEVMVPEDEALQTLTLPDRFVITPAFEYATKESSYKDHHGGDFCADGFRYSSDCNDQWFSVDDLRKLVSDWKVTC